VVLDSSGKWEKVKKQVVTMVKSALNSISIYVARAPNIEVRVLEQLYNSLAQSHIMTGGNLGNGRWVERNRKSL
jgi:hypothetical protein